jgi:anti-anti-sigma factor
MAKLEGPGASLVVTEPSLGHLSVILTGEYDFATVRELAADLEALLERDAESVVIDMSGLKFMDTSGVAVLLRIANRFGTLEVGGAKPLIQRTIRALGLSERLRIRAD